MNNKPVGLLKSVRAVQKNALAVIPEIAYHGALIDIPADQVTLADLPGAPEGHDIRSVDVLIHITSRDE